MPEYLDRFSTFLAETHRDAFSTELREVITRILADTVAVIAAGSRETEVSELSERISVAAGPVTAAIIGTSLRAEPRMAALVNGTAGTSLELDEGNKYSGGHPGIHVIPAALATAEIMNADTDSFLSALILGYEAAARVGISSRLRQNVHVHGTWGTIGAAVAVGRLKRYTAAQFREVINIAACLNIATNRKAAFTGGTVRNINAGAAGHNGMLASELLDCGFTGEPNALETIYGSVLSDAFDVDALMEDLGSRWEISRNYFKLHAACRHVHGALDAALVLRRENPNISFGPDTIEMVKVETFSPATLLAHSSPSNMLAAKFSLPFAVAVALINGDTSTEGFRPFIVKDPFVQALSSKVQVIEDPDLTSLLPDKRPARVTLKMVGGETISVTKYTNKGDPEDPYDDATLREKFDDLVAPIWGNDSTNLRTVIDALSSGGDLSALFPLLAVRQFVGRPVA